MSLTGAVRDELAVASEPDGEPGSGAKLAGGVGNGGYFSVLELPGR
jgi:hypothetical protein